MDTIAISWRRSQLRYTPLADFFSKYNAYFRLSLLMHKPAINDSYSEEIPWHHPAWCNEYINSPFLSNTFGHTPPENPESREKVAPHDLKIIVYFRPDSVIIGDFGGIIDAISVEVPS